MAMLRAQHRQTHIVHPEAVESARASMLPDDTLITLAENFAALADSNRMKILFALTAGRMCVCDLASVVGVSESAISQHLRVLRSLRWVAGQREGRRVYYSLSDEHVRDLLEAELEHVQGR